MLTRRWLAAGEHFEAAIDVHVKVNRRSWVPCMAYIAALCYASAEDNTRRDALWGVVMKYKAMNKKNWRAEDLQCFDMTEAMIANPPANPDIELLFLLKRMAQTRGVPADSARAMIGNMQSRMPDLKPDDAARAWLLQAEFHRLDQNVDNVLRCTDEAIALSGSLSPLMGKMAVMPEVWLTRVVALITVGRLTEAGENLEKIDSGLLKPLTKEDRMDFDFRKSAVRQWLVDTKGGAGAAQSQSEDPADEDGFLSAGEEEEAEEPGKLDDFLS